jgi:hypothetical protein
VGRQQPVLQCRIRPSLIWALKYVDDLSQALFRQAAQDQIELVGFLRHAFDAKLALRENKPGLRRVRPEIRELKVERRRLPWSRLWTGGVGGGPAASAVSVSLIAGSPLLRVEETLHSLKLHYRLTTLDNYLGDFSACHAWRIFPLTRWRPACRHTFVIMNFLPYKLCDVW